MASDIERVLVTGGTGFVGRQILRALSDRGADVRAVVRSGREADLAGYPAVKEIVSSASLFHEDQRWWRKTSEDVDLVIHAAWYAEPRKYLTSPINIDCLAGTLTMAKGCVDAGIRRFVGIGTCFEYDVSDGRLSVETPLKPATIYGDAKASTYLALSHWLPSVGVEFAWCRLFYLFGEGEDDRRFVPYLRAKLAAGEPVDLTAGNQIRDYMNVRDAGRMTVDAAIGPRQGAINICSGIPVTIRELAERISDEYGGRSLLNFGARPDNVIDPPCVVGTL
ncbi:NAD(P)-dependent oxidoreductase [Mesorhizobium sp. CAU 1741]|uniref:NAD-dependent epimerase/dehydratase family protein n=1 Tax=Mesorhizobium sp. CAU 1741 TaxID=3140366 RepID=UPI00325C041E